MSYKTGEAAIISIIQGLAAWDTENSISLANDTTLKGAAIMNSGKSDKYCFATPGPFVSRYLDTNGTVIEDEWTTVVRLIVLALPKSGASPENELATARQDIKEALDARYNLGGGFSFAKLTAGDEIINDGVAEFGPYIEQELFVTWMEEQDIAQLD